MYACSINKIKWNDTKTFISTYGDYVHERQINRVVMEAKLIKKYKKTY